MLTFVIVLLLISLCTIDLCIVVGYNWMLGMTIGEGRGGLVAEIEICGWFPFGGVGIVWHALSTIVFEF